MNQKSLQNAKSIERDLNPLKLPNNTNFGYDYRNDFDICTFEPIYNEITKITYIKKHYNLFDKSVSKFVNSDLIEKHVEKTYNKKMLQIKNDFLKNGRIEYLNIEKQQSKEALEQVQAKEKKNHKKRTIKNIETRLEEANNNSKIKNN